MGRLDHSDSPAHRHSARRFDHMGCVFFLCLSLLQPIRSAQILYRQVPTYLGWRGLTRLSHRLASNVSSTGPAAASNFDPDYVFTPADIMYTKITFSTSVLYFLVTCTTKISFLLLLYRIFAISRSFRLWIYAAEAVVVAFWISATVADCLNCIPLEWTWKNGNADPRYCINYNAFWLGTGVSESVIDLGILALPIGMISKLQLDRGKKYAVVGLFLLGGL
jgi:hypothetical protein